MYPEGIQHSQKSRWQQPRTRRPLSDYVCLLTQIKAISSLHVKEVTILLPRIPTCEGRLNLSPQIKVRTHYRWNLNNFWSKQQNREFFQQCQAAYNSLRFIAPPLFTIHKCRYNQLCSSILVRNALANSSGRWNRPNNWNLTIHDIILQILPWPRVIYK